MPSGKISAWQTTGVSISKEVIRVASVSPGNAGATLNTLLNPNTKFTSRPLDLIKARDKKIAHDKWVINHQRELDQKEKQKAIELAAQEQQSIQVEPKAAPQYTGSVQASCGDTPLAHFIYSHESGCSTSQWTGSCYGIGQDCNNIVYARCGASYACQNAYFTDYMLRRYGSWANAYAFGMAQGTPGVNDGWGWW